LSDIVSGFSQKYFVRWISNYKSFKGQSKNVLAKADRLLNIIHGLKAVAICFTTAIEYFF